MVVTDEELEHAAAVLRDGGLVAFPTETVYGLGVDAACPAALRRLYAVKGRPADHPVIVHVAAVRDLESLARALPAVARDLAAACWPGPLTLVVDRHPGAVADEATGGRSTVAVRMPDHQVALGLLRAFGEPVAAPSANRFGRVSPTSAGAVRAELGGEVDVVLDGGPCAIGVESTIVDCSAPTPVVLRVGGVTADRLAEIVGAPVRTAEVAGGAPGTLPVHYAPRARVELVATADLAARVAAHLAADRRVGIVAPASAVAAAGRTAEDPDVLLAADGAAGFARGLYRALRDADDRGLDVVVAVPPVEEGLGVAVADRLRRAAAASG